MKRQDQLIKNIADMDPRIREQRDMMLEFSYALGPEKQAQYWLMWFSHTAEILIRMNCPPQALKTLLENTAQQIRSSR